jgi:MFS family permease
VLNAGILIANNGFMIKNSPTENRTMYIAATQALAGIVGGLTSILAGAVMMRLAGHHWTIAGVTFGHFQVMFLTSIALRWVALGLTRYVQEPEARQTWDVVQELVTEMLDRLDFGRVLPRSDESSASYRLATREFSEGAADTGSNVIGSDLLAREALDVESVQDESHPRIPAPKRLRRVRQRESQPT